MQNFWRFFRMVFHYWRLLAVAMGASLLEAVCTFSGFGALLWVVDQLLGGKQSLRDLILSKLEDGALGDWNQPATEFVNTYVPADPFWGFALLIGVILGLTILGSTMRYIHQVCTASAVIRTTTRLRMDVYRRQLSAKFSKQVGVEATDMISRGAADTGTISQGIRTLLGSTVRNVLSGLVMFVLAIIIDWKLSLLFMLSIPVVGLVIRKFGKAMKRITHRTLKYSARLLLAWQETVLNRDTIRLQQAEGYARRRLHEVLVRSMLKEQLRAVRVRAITAPVVETFSIVAVAGVALLAAYFIFANDQDPKTLVKVLVTLAVGAASLKKLANLNNELQASAAAADRVAEILSLPMEKDEDADKPRLPRHHSEIEFRDIDFAYPGSDRMAVGGVSLKIKHGMTVALVGPNGAGKTTLVHMLPRLIDPSAGQILIDGVDIQSVSIRSLREQISVVSQQSVLFGGTMAANIALGRPAASREAIVAAAKAARADEFIEMLPRKYDSRLTERGGGLSGGQRQRMCIARAILRDPAILILDEATSQIDSESEAKISAAIQELAEGRTTFIIAHRLATVINADLIVVMEDGQISDMGTHTELLSRSQMYAALCNTQLMPVTNG